MQKIFEALVVELERPRELTGQVIHHLGAHHEVVREAVGAFLEKSVATLEDYEIDLLLSPLFTPTVTDQGVFAELLGRESLPASEWPGLIAGLARRPTVARLVTPDGATHPVALREVTIERYVNRLRLDATIPKALFQWLCSVPPVDERAILKAVARRAIWAPEARRQILERYLMATAGPGRETHRLEDALELLKLVETYNPADTPDLVARLPHWQQVLRHEISMATDPKPFFNDRIQDMHGGGRDQRRTDAARLEGWKRELAALERLRTMLAE